MRRIEALEAPTAGRAGVSFSEPSRHSRFYRTLIQCNSWRRGVRRSITPVIWGCAGGGANGFFDFGQLYGFGQKLEGTQSHGFGFAANLGGARNEDDGDVGECGSGFCEQLETGHDRHAHISQNDVEGGVSE